MKYKLIQILRRFKNSAINLLNKLSPKRNRIIVIGNHKIEDNAIEIANYLVDNCKLDIYYEVSEEYIDQVSKLLSSRIKLIKTTSSLKLIKYITTKYIFYTYPFGFAFYSSSKRQKLVNIWHGIALKNLAKGRNKSSPGIPADWTIASSPLTQKMFSELFGVPEKSVLITGYPRNDMLLKAKEEKEILKQNLPESVRKFREIIIWMPTYRILQSDSQDKLPTHQKVNLDQIFQVQDFQVHKFNELLKENNVLCLVKPHQLYDLNIENSQFSNIIFIDNDWIYEQGLSLYQFLACTDILISDYSSVMLDYILLDQPIFCLATDLEEYKKTQGLYFDDYENWVPAKHHDRQTEFFEELQDYLETKEDKRKLKRYELKNIYYSYHDTNASKRIMGELIEDKYAIKS